MPTTSNLGNDTTSKTSAVNIVRALHYTFGIKEITDAAKFKLIFNGSLKEVELYGSEEDRETGMGDTAPLVESNLAIATFCGICGHFMDAQLQRGKITVTPSKPTWEEFHAGMAKHCTPGNSCQDSKDPKPPTIQKFTGKIGDWLAWKRLTRAVLTKCNLLKVIESKEVSEIRLVLVVGRRGQG